MEFKVGDSVLALNGGQLYLAKACIVEYEVTCLNMTEGIDSSNSLTDSKDSAAGRLKEYRIYGSYQRCLYLFVRR